MKNKINKLINQGEDQTLEFKSSFGKKTIETLTAFSNTEGGSVLIGVDNKGTVIGVDIGKETVQNWVNQIKNSTTPSIIPDTETIFYNDKSIVCLKVIPYPIKPVSFLGRYFKRVHNSNHLMQLSEIADEHLKAFNLSWDFAVDPIHHIKDISLKKVNRFIDRCNNNRDIPITDDPLTVLKSLSCIAVIR